MQTAELCFSCSLRLYSHKHEFKLTYCKEARNSNSLDVYRVNTCGHVTSRREDFLLKPEIPLHLKRCYQKHLKENTNLYACYLIWWHDSWHLCNTSRDFVNYFPLIQTYRKIYFNCSILKVTSDIYQCNSDPVNLWTMSFPVSYTFYVSIFYCC